MSASFLAAMETRADDAVEKTTARESDEENGEDGEDDEDTCEDCDKQIDVDEDGEYLGGSFICDVCEGKFCADCRSFEVRTFGLWCCKCGGDGSGSKNAALGRLILAGLPYAHLIPPPKAAAE